MRVIVTRPEPDAGRWVQALAAQGIDALALPLIAIGAAPQPQQVAQARAQLGEFDAVMFVSSNAVAGFFEGKTAAARTSAAWAAIKTRAWATGPGTRDALLAAGVPAAQLDAPADDAPQFDSEALWQRVQHQVREGSRLLVVRGGDASGQARGRDWLGQQLEAAGAELCTVVSYVRLLPEWSAASQSTARAAADGSALWLFSSSEAIANLQALLPGQSWASAQAVATHPRIAQAAHDAGFGAVGHCRPGIAGLRAFLQSTR